ncbi:uncharacterized protein LOC114766819 [Denticeps clupeoides]|uniref:uncharacterized protein LOC114766819 n=1 Tax=Denticeps clupeoides TaxID=299321 RepID=UPI0010A2B8B0|nr:uncharacterized protein LOC114766819 [Denticeps clupeoides]
MGDQAKFSRTEVRCARLVPLLPLWVIEHAWSKEMLHVMEVVGPPLWLEGDWGSLSLQDSCSVRVAAAEAWAVLKARDVQHFERVVDFLEAVHKLLPCLVSPMKHMKILFGFKTLIIMWMFREDHRSDKTMEKVLRFFPCHFSQYNKCGRRNRGMMKKIHQDFSDFSRILAKDDGARRSYIRDLMEEQYGELYARKLQERLHHYLKQLEAALPRSTHIDEILNQDRPLTDGEELLLELLTSSSAPPAVALERLLRCALTDHHSISSQSIHSPPVGQVLTASQLLMRCLQDRTREERPSPRSCSQSSIRSSFLLHLDSTQPGNSGIQTTADLVLTVRAEGTGALDSPLLLEDGLAWSEESWEDGQRQECHAEEQMGGTQGAGRMCTRHGKLMRNVLQECSEELRSPLSPYEPATPSQPSQHEQSRSTRATTGGVVLSKESQSILIRSMLFQPQVRLRRIPDPDGNVSTDVEDEDEEDEYILFDVNRLFSDSDSSESSDTSDSDYTP